MRKFQDAYQDAIDELPKYHIDVDAVLAANNRAEMTLRQKSGQGGYKRALKLAATAAALFLLCGVGSATAINYQKSKITVGNTGYSVTSEGVMVVSEDEFVIDITDEERGDGAGNSREKAAAGEASAVAETYAAAEVLEAKIAPEPVSYDSVEAFRASEAITVAIPDSELLGMEFEIQNIMVMEDFHSLMVRLQSDEQIFALRQQDNREHEQYASSTTYMGESVNERNLINEQGLSYVVFDTMEEGEIVATHAVISVNGRDLTLDFYGFGQESVEKVLTQLDLSIYFQD